MKITCPTCQNVLPVEQVSIDTGWAKCVDCQEVFQVEEIAKSLPATKDGVKFVSSPRERPFDAKVIIASHGNQFALEVPKTGIQAGHWGLLGFATFWTAFIAFWTAGALGFVGGNGPQGVAQWGFAAFSIPFWIVGIGMFVGVIYSTQSHRRVAIDASSAIFDIQCLGLRRTKRLERSQIQAARFHEPKVQSSKDPPPSQSVEIVYEGGSFVVPCQTESEAKWVLHSINSFLQSTASSARAPSSVRETSFE